MPFSRTRRLRRSSASSYRVCHLVRTDEQAELIRALTSPLVPLRQRAASSGHADGGRGHQLRLLRRILARSVTTTIAAKGDERPTSLRPSRLHSPTTDRRGSHPGLSLGRPDFWPMRPVFGRAQPPALTRDPNAVMSRCRLCGHPMAGPGGTCVSSFSTRRSVECPRGSWRWPPNTERSTR